MKILIVLLGLLPALVLADTALLLSRADALAGREPPRLAAAYAGGLQALAGGRTAAAFNHFDYAAWQGSLAAALRLCVMDGAGLHTAPNPAKAAWWCARAAAAGHPEGLAHLQAQADGRGLLALP